MSQQFDVRPSVLYENRYCDQNEFDIIINHECNESEESTNQTIQIESDNVNCNVVLIPVSANYYYAKTAAICSDIFVLNGSEKIVRKTCCVDVRSKSTWKNLTPMPGLRKNFSVCSFMKSIYLIGGLLNRCFKAGFPKLIFKIAPFSKI